MKKQSQLRIRKRKPKEHLDSLPLPTDEKVITLARIIEKKIRKEEVREKYAPVKHVLALLGTGAVLSLSLFVAPSAIMLAKPFLDEKYRRDESAWKRYNPYYLKRAIRRLREQKLVTVEERDGEEVVTLTNNGKRRILRYSLEDLEIEKPRVWDGYWRLVIYDVSVPRRALRDMFRETIRGLGFYQLQESVWIYPYPCEEQITFLREFYGVGTEVIYVVAKKLEDDEPYRTYFGLV
ncbi:hypothetical protein HY339_02065 [Candidatus Gottesmanbacteria bacterium]|nr:hypothetical protein [Candidatus Gottesmanbacteria bacterium]